VDTTSAGTIAIILVFFLLASGVHVGIALITSGFIGTMLISGFIPAIKMVSSAMYFKISSPVLISLPLFILMGYLASAGGVSQNIYNSLNMWLGRFKSGMGISTVVACAIFGTVCGSTLVTTAVFSKISAPEMRRHGYEKELAYSICAASGSIGMLIPPSVLAIVYGMLSGLSIGKVLIAGIAPGILLTIGFSILITLIGIVKPSSIQFHKIPSVTWRQRIISLKGGWTVGIVAFTLFAGMYGGVFSPTEAAAVAAFTLIIVYLIVSVRNKSLQKIVNEMTSSLRETAITSAMIFLIFGGATVFSNFLVLAGITAKISEFFVGSGLPNYAIVIMFMIIVLSLGCFVDCIANISITLPVFIPIVNAVGIDALWFATMNILAVEIGLVTPPVGMNMFVAKGVAESDVNLEDIISGCLPFFIVMIICLTILFLFPPVSTFLPGFVQ
jgi:C4-dicarboxylate transporter DctM subunit